MDTPIIIIGLVFLAIVALPLYFVLRGGKPDHKQINALFVHYNQGGTYNFKLIAANRRKAVGMDPDKKGLLFMDFNLSEPHVSFHDLSKISRCDVAISNVAGRANVPERVEWLFLSENGKLAENSVVFHDAKKNYIVPIYVQEELELARQWRKMIEKHL